MAAVLAGSAALTIGLIGATSDDAQQRRQYVPQAIPGEVLLFIDQSDDTAVEVARKTVADTAPELVAAPMSYVTSALPDEPPAEAFWADYVVARSSTCSIGEAILHEPSATPTSCQSVGGPMSMQQILTLPTHEIVRRFELTGADAQAVRDGAGVLLASKHTDDLAVDGSVTVAQGQRLVDPDTYEANDTRRVTTINLPVVSIPSSKQAMGRSLNSSLLVPTTTAEEAGWPTEVSSLVLHDPDGPIAQVTVERLDAARGGTGWVYTEQGYQDPLTLVLAVLLGIFTVLLLVVTLTSTALSLAEQAQDQATLAAVGAGRRTRRLMAGAQTLVLALIGVVLGAAVGVVPGIAIAMELTSQGWDPVTGEMLTKDATIVIPWLALLVMTVAVPLLAGAIAAAGIRRAPDATQRAQ